jgi:hypothetical protein
MVRTITAFALFICTFVSAQGKFEDGMNQAFKLWGEGKPTEASAMFERIASAEKGSWLPNYYVALVNTTTSFTIKDKQQIAALLDKAQKALDIEMDKAPENPELMILQALIYTAWVVEDPMTNAMKYGAQITELYTKALIIAPENPRAVFGKAEYEMGGAKYFGKDTKPMCAEIDRSIGLFEKFRPETPLHPHWGLDRALEAQKACQGK